MDSLPAAGRQISLPAVVQSLDGAVTNKLLLTLTLILTLTLFPNS